MSVRCVGMTTAAWYRAGTTSVRWASSGKHRWGSTTCAMSTTNPSTTFSCRTDPTDMQLKVIYAPNTEQWLAAMLVLLLCTTEINFWSDLNETTINVSTELEMMSDARQNCGKIITSNIRSARNQWYLKDSVFLVFNYSHSVTKFQFVVYNSRHLCDVNCTGQTPFLAHFELLWPAFVRRPSSINVLAHLSTKCAIVTGLCPSSVVVRRPSTFYLNIFSSETAHWILTKLHRNDP